MAEYVNYEIWATDKTKPGTDSAKRNLTGLQRAVEGLKGALGTGALRFATYAGGVALATKAVTNLGRAINDAIKSAGEQQRSMLQLERVVRTTGYAAGMTANQLGKLASGLQKVTTYGDEDILVASKMMATFTKISSDVFPRALEASIDLSEGLGQDLKQSVIQLGKALNDPMIGLTALRRSGVSFSDEQTRMIKQLTLSGRLFEAQDEILKELRIEMGGVGRAAVDSYSGAQDRLRHAVGDLGQAFANPLLPGLTGATEGFTQLAEAGTRFFELFDGNKATNSLDFVSSLQGALDAMDKSALSKPPEWLKLLANIAEKAAAIETLSRFIDRAGSGPRQQVLEDRAAMDKAAGRAAMEYLHGLQMTGRALKKIKEVENAIYARRLEAWDAWQKMPAVPAAGPATTLAFGNAPGDTGIAGAGAGGLLDETTLQTSMDLVKNFQDFIELKDELGEMTGSVWAMGQAMASMSDLGSTAMTSLLDAVVGSLHGMSGAYREFGKVILKWAADTIKGIAASAAAKALYYVAEGWAWSSMGMATRASQAFTAAKMYGRVAVVSGVAAVAVGSASASNAPEGSFLSQQERERTTGLARSSSSGQAGGGATTTTIEQARLAATSFTVTHNYFAPVYFGSQDESTVAGIQTLLNTGALYVSQERQ